MVLIRRGFNMAPGFEEQVSHLTIVNQSLNPLTLDNKLFDLRLWFWRSQGAISTVSLFPFTFNVIRLILFNVWRRRWIRNRSFWTKANCKWTIRFLFGAAERPNLASCRAVTGNKRPPSYTFKKLRFLGSSSRSSWTCFLRSWRLRYILDSSSSNIMSRGLLPEPLKTEILSCEPFFSLFVRDWDTRGTMSMRDLDRTSLDSEIFLVESIDEETFRADLGAWEY